VKTLHVLNLGAGVQSTTLYLMFARGDLKPQIDCAIFADTGDEPSAVYRHLDWLQSLNGPRILIRSAGRIGDDLMRGRNSTGQRFVSIPAFTAEVQGKQVGMVRRQCTKEYKLEVIERAVRREKVGLKPRQRFPLGDVFIIHYIGISFDEIGRSIRVEKRFEAIPWAKPVFPLVEKQMSRTDCKRWLRAFGVPHEVPRSACVFCPYHTNDEWRWLRHNDPEGFQRAIEVDAALRKPGNVVNRGFNQKLYVHRSCVPLSQAPIGPNDPTEEVVGTFYEECAGVCGV
jgi:hypothetical protein